MGFHYECGCHHSDLEKQHEIGIGTHQHDDGTSSRLLDMHDILRVNLLFSHVNWGNTMYASANIEQ